LQGSFSLVAVGIFIFGWALSAFLYRLGGYEQRQF